MLVAIGRLFSELLLVQHSQNKLIYLIETKTKVSPNFIYTTCAHCSTQFLMSYEIGNGQNYRPPRPNNFGIKNLVAFKGDDCYHLLANNR